MTELDVRLAGEEVRLLPERALFWPRTATLIVADLHWGKGATFRAAGIPIPLGSTSDDLARLDAALAAHRRRPVDRPGRSVPRARRQGRSPHARRAPPVARPPPQARDDAGARQPRPPRRRPARRPPDQLRQRAGVRAAVHPAPRAGRFAPATTPWPDTCIRAWCCAAARSGVSACPASCSAIAWPCCRRLAALPGSASSSRDPGERAFVIGDGEVIEVERALRRHG